MEKIDELKDFVKICNSSKMSVDNTEPKNIVEIDIDVSANTFFKKPNNYDEEAILEHYTQLEMLVRSAYNEHKRYENKYSDFRISSNKDNPNHVDENKKVLKVRDKNINELNKKYKSLRKIVGELQSKKLKELKTSNEQIAGFKSYHNLYKNLQYAREIFLGSSDKTPNFNFLEKDTYKNYAIRKLLAEQPDCDTVDFTKKIKELTNEAEKSFKKIGKKLSEYLPPVSFWRKICFKENHDDIRHNFNATEYDENGIKKSNDYYKYSNWIEKLKGDTKLNQMVIPGAHDAGTYSMRPKNKFDLVGKMAQTQTGNFTAMLRSGIRYFDWRMKKVGETFIFYHGKVTGGNVLEAIHQIDKFLYNHKNEIIIISLVADNSCLKDFLKISTINNFFKMRVYEKDSNVNIGTLTLDEIRKKGKNVIIINGNDAVKKYGFDVKEITGTYNPETRKSNSTKKMLSAEAYFAKEAVKKVEDSNGKKLSALSPIHTPGVRSVLSYLFGHKKGVHNIPVREASKNFVNNMNKFEEKLKDPKTSKVKWTNFVRYDNVNDRNVKKVTEKLIKENEHLKQ